MLRIEVRKRRTAYEIPVRDGIRGGGEARNRIPSVATIAVATTTVVRHWDLRPLALGPYAKVLGLIRSVGPEKICG